MDGSEQPAPSEEGHGGEPAAAMAADKTIGNEQGKQSEGGAKGWIHSVGQGWMFGGRRGSGTTNDSEGESTDYPGYEQRG